VLIADTAGRLHTQSGLMDELSKIKRVLAKLDPGAPHEVLLVIDGTTGQNAISQLRQFHAAAGVTGLVVTKLDGTAKGGVVFALAREFGIPIRYVCTPAGLRACFRRRLAAGVARGLTCACSIATRSLPSSTQRFLLQQASQATGLTFTLAAPAGVGLWPDLHLELEGLTAHAPGVTNAVFRSAQVDIVVPWSALQGDTLQLRSLRLQAPVLDTVALSQWWSSRSQDGPPAPLRLPRFDAAIEITDARLQAAQWAIAGLDASLPFLRTGAAVNLQAGGRIEADTREPIAFSFDLLATPTEIDGGLRLDPMQLELEGRVALLAVTICPGSRTARRTASGFPRSCCSRRRSPP
jgi:hypothetical protein